MVFSGSGRTLSSKLTSAYLTIPVRSMIYLAGKGDVQESAPLGFGIQYGFHGKAIYIAATENDADPATRFEMIAQKGCHTQRPGWLHHQFHAVE
jgi:hypothetical protein